MRKTIVKKPKKLLVKPGVKSSPSKPSKTGLSKSDPKYFSKIGAISAKKRQMTSAEFSAMAKKSHPRKEYKGGRKTVDGRRDRPESDAQVAKLMTLSIKRKEDDGDAALAVLDRDLRRATNQPASR